MRGMWFNYDPPVLSIFPAVEGGELTGVMLLFRALPVSAVLRPQHRAMELTLITTIHTITITTKLLDWKHLTYT